MEAKKVETISILVSLAAMVGIYYWFSLDRKKRSAEFEEKILREYQESDNSYQRGFLDAKKQYEKPASNKKGVKK